MSTTYNQSRPGWFYLFGRQRWQMLSGQCPFLLHSWKANWSHTPLGEQQHGPAPGALLSSVRDLQQRYPHFVPGRCYSMEGCWKICFYSLFQYAACRQGTYLLCSLHEVQCQATKLGWILSQLILWSCWSLGECFWCRPYQHPITLFPCLCPCPWSFRFHSPSLFLLPLFL